MALICLWFLFRLFPPTANSAPPSSFSLLACILTWSKPSLSFLPPVRSCSFFHLFSNNFHLSDFIQLHRVPGVCEWRPLSSRRLNAVHRWCTAFPKTTALSFLKELRDLFFDKVYEEPIRNRWTEQCCVNTTSCSIELEHSAFQRYCYSWKTCSCRLLSWKARAA